MAASELVLIAVRALPVEEISMVGKTVSPSRITEGLGDDNSTSSVGANAL